MSDNRTLCKQILNLIELNPGLTDREITTRLFGPAKGQQAVNQCCRALERHGRIIRRKRSDGKIGNYPVNSVAEQSGQEMSVDGLEQATPSGEDAIKANLETWLKSNGWNPTIQWGHDRGIDIDARRGNERWVIEVKGLGKHPQMRVNFFLVVLGVILQRMQDEQAHHSIAFPDHPQFRGLWDRLPRLAKSRTGITALFVAQNGMVSEQP